jgi:hypothetical protein
MNCKVAKTLFVSYQDGDIKSSERRAFEKHLAKCETCRLEWDDYQRTLAEITGMHDLLPPSDFVSKVKTTIGKRSKGRFFGESHHPSIVFAVVSFVLILLFLLAYLVITHSTEIRIEPAAGAEIREPPASLPSDAEE